MRTFKTKPFARFARKAGLKNDVLAEAVRQAVRGLVDADLGGNIIKQRIAREGAGKSGGFRSIIVIRSGDRAIFVHGYGKNEKADITPEELKAFKLLAVQLLALSQKQLEAAINERVLTEIMSNDEAV